MAEPFFKYETESFIAGFTSKDDFKEELKTEGLNSRFSFKLIEGIHVVKKNMAFLKNKIGLSDYSMIIGKQIHGNQVRMIETFSAFPNESIGEFEADSMMTARKKVILGVISADCLPVLVIEEKNKIISAIHAGWRGTLLAILEKRLKDFCTMFPEKERLKFSIFIGPHIEQDCYEIKEDLLTKFQPYKIYIKKRGKKFFLDLLGINREIIEKTLKLHSFEIRSFPDCTYCSEKFFSYRREGSDTGCQVGFIALK